uniref:Uncharacterized protein n=1 Tax=Anguilla anguilla TaxID=7936 RepID=A0A0E9S6M3_ANGAN
MKLCLERRTQVFYFLIYTVNKRKLILTLNLTTISRISISPTKLL